MNQVKAIILAGSHDFGRCPISSKLPVCLWPKLDKPVLQCLLDNLRKQNINDIVICPGANKSIEDVVKPASFGDINFLDEELPFGTAGCLREAAKKKSDEKLFVILNGAMISPPDFNLIIKKHINSKCEMSVILEPEITASGLEFKPSEIYICESSVVEHIPPQGFCDLKEGLIPNLTLAGKLINVIKLNEPVGNYRTHDEYINAISNYLKILGNNCNENHFSEKGIWVDKNVEISTKAKIYGPAIIMAGSIISQEALILGPSVIGRNVFVGEKTLIDNSVIWDNSKIGKDCFLKKTLVDSCSIVPSRTLSEEKVLAAKNNSFIQHLMSSLSFKFGNTSDLLINQFIPNRKLTYLAGSIILMAIFIWSYWFNLAELFSIWYGSDEYSVGIIVPFFAGYILWDRWKKISGQGYQICLWGFWMLICSQFIRYFGAYYMYSSAERFSIIFSIASIILLLFGWKILNSLLPLLLFLCLMLPLPRSIHSIIMVPLQNLATKSAVFYLELFGYPVARQGNIIELHGTTIAISEACNGLRMIMAFLVVTAFIVLLMQGPVWKKVVVFASSLPIAVLCNTIRLTGTTLAFDFLSTKELENFFHSFGGYAMMPLAVAVIFFELWLLSKITFTKF